MRGIIYLVLCLWGGPALADSPWPPHLLATSAKERGVAQVTLHGMVADKVQVFSPGEGFSTWEESLTEGKGGVTLPRPRGGYHWLVATESRDKGEHVATTAHFFPMAGSSPTALLARAKHALELVPQPLPREYQHYRGGESWRFMVRFAGVPLAGAQVWLYAKGNQPVAFATNEQGVAQVLFPTSGVANKNGGRHGPQSPFVLQVTHDPGEQHYLTTFAHTFGPPPAGHLAQGVGVCVVGMVLGSLLWRRKGGVS